MRQWRTIKEQIRRELYVVEHRMEDEYYLFIASTDCDDIYPSNQAYDFTIVLPRPVNLRGVWKCALLNLTFQPRHSTPTAFIINCDIVRHSYVRGHLLPVLNIAHECTTTENYAIQVVEFTNPLYHYLNRTVISTFRIRIRNAVTLLEASHMLGTLTCVLHLRRERHDYAR